MKRSCLHSAGDLSRTAESSRNAQNRPSWNDPGTVNARPDGFQTCVSVEGSLVSSIVERRKDDERPKNLEWRGQPGGRMNLTIRLVVGALVLTAAGCAARTANPTALAEVAPPVVEYPPPRPLGHVQPPPDSPTLFTAIQLCFPT